MTPTPPTPLPRTAESLTIREMAAVRSILDRATRLTEASKQHAPRDGALGIGSEQTRNQAWADALLAFRAAFWQGHSPEECLTKAREQYVVWAEKFNATCDLTVRIHVPQTNEAAPDIIWWAYHALKNAGL